MRTVGVIARYIGFEIRDYFRSWDQLVFTFLFPVMMLLLFDQLLGGTGPIQTGPGGPTVTMGAYMLPGLAAAGVWFSTVQNLAFLMTQERHDGTLRRLGGTPMAPSWYLAGKLGQAVVTGLIQLVLLMAVGRVVLGISLPSEAHLWLRFAWIVALGFAAMAPLGIALARVPRDARSAAAVIIPIGLILQFTSGVYFPYSSMPDWLRTASSFFPLKWEAQGMRAVFLPESFAMDEQGGAWHLEQVALALGVWFLLGLVLAKLTFKWTKRNA